MQKARENDPTNSGKPFIDGASFGVQQTAVGMRAGGYEFVWVASLAECNTFTHLRLVRLLQDHLHVTHRRGKKSR